MASNLSLLVALKYAPSVTWAISLSVFSSILGAVSYYVWSIKEQLDFTIAQNHSLTAKLNKLEEKLVSTDFALNQKKHLFSNSDSYINPDIAKALIENAPMIIGTVAACALVYAYLPKSWSIVALLKYSLPENVTKKLEDWKAPGFVETVLYTHSDSENGIDYLYSIINNKTVNCEVKGPGLSDCTSIYSYVSDLLKRNMENTSLCPGDNSTSGNNVLGSAAIVGGSHSQSNASVESMSNQLAEKL